MRSGCIGMPAQSAFCAHCDGWLSPQENYVALNNASSYPGAPFHAGPNISVETTYPRKDASLWLLGWLRPVRSRLTERGKVHADDGMARFVRGRCHVSTGAGETPDISVYRRCLTAPRKSLQLVMEKGNRP